MSTISTPRRDPGNVVELCPYSERAYAAGRELVARVEEILPRLAARAAEAEALGRVPDASIEDMRAVGMYRALVPRERGGLEIDPASFMEAVIAIATACPSAGWVGAFFGVHAWQIALLPPTMQDEFWADGVDVRAASSYSPTGKVTSVEGGFRLDGTWAFCSGIDHADWIILGGVVKDDPDGPEFRSFVVPRADWTVVPDSWNVAGLRGSGSKAITLKSVFVPEHRTHRVSDAQRGTDPGLAVNPGALYRVPWLTIFYSAISSTAVGAALGGLAWFVEDAKTRVSPLSGQPAAANPFLHLRIANGLSSAEAMRDRSLARWRQIFDTLCRGEALSRVERTKSRFEFADVTASSYLALSEVYETAGGGAIAASKPLQRVFRDLMAMRNHPTATRELFASVYVQSLLDLPPPPFDKSAMGSLAFHA
jgi:3-hydroxy-9,10-secoandrosta-1,3,5(10)-triene-9,17-dione monooxygenase